MPENIFREQKKKSCFALGAATVEFFFKSLPQHVND